MNSQSCRKNYCRYGPHYAKTTVMRIRAWVNEHSPGYLTCYNTTMLERRLALELGTPLSGVDPVLLSLGKV